MTLHLSEVRGGVAQAIALDHSKDQIKAFTASAASLDTAFDEATEVIRLVATQDCHYKIGAAPTATTSSSFLPANVIEYVKVNLKDTNGAPVKETLSVIRNATDGTLYVSEAK